MANVYWFKGRSDNIRKNLISKLDTLIGLEEMTALMTPDSSLAIKFNLSEIGYGHYLPPIIFTTFFEKARNRNVRPMLTDGCSLFRGSRFNGYNWSGSTNLLGFSAGESFQNQLLQSGGYTNEEGNFWPCEGENLAGIDIGSLLTDTNNLLVISHITAHPQLGLSGAIANMSLGFLTATGRQRIHSFLKVDWDAEKCDHCGECLPFCPTGAIAGEPGKVTFDARICNQCLGCHMACPNGAILVDPETVPAYQECVVEAAHTVTKKLRG